MCSCERPDEHIPARSNPPGAPSSTLPKPSTRSVLRLPQRFVEHGQVVRVVEHVVQCAIRLGRVDPQHRAVLLENHLFVFHRACDGRGSRCYSTARHFLFPRKIHDPFGHDQRLARGHHHAGIALAAKVGHAALALFTGRVFRGIPPGLDIGIGPLRNAVANHSCSCCGC